MNTIVNYAKWSASNLPAGLKIKNGVICGTPTAEVGKYTVPLTVRTHWGTDIKDIKVNVLKKAKYEIYQNGEKLEEVSLSDLITSIRNGTAQEKYNCTNTQIMIPITTPTLAWYDTTQKSYKLRTSQTDIVAVNFCSFRNVTLADGSVKPGLILQFDRTLWQGYCCFDTGDVVSNPDFPYITYGTLDDYGFDYNTIMNRWKYCNLRQWLNSKGSNWFNPVYDTDVLLKYSDNVIRDDYNGVALQYSVMRNAVNGFLSCLPDDLVEALQPIKIQTQVIFNENNFDESIEEPDTINGVYVDTTYDKVFIPSLEEMNFAPANDKDGYLPDSAFTAGWDPNSVYEEDGKKNYPEDGIEGTAWEYYINKFGTQSRFTGGGNTFNGINDFGKNLGEDFELPEKSYYLARENSRVYARGQLTRSPVLSESPYSKNYGVIGVWGVGKYQKSKNSDFTLEGIFYGAPHDRIDCYGRYDNYLQPAPAFVLY